MACMGGSRFKVDSCLHVCTFARFNRSFTAYLRFHLIPTYTFVQPRRKVYENERRF